MTKPQTQQTSRHALPHGYIEGYYGRLLNWDERMTVLEKLAHLQMNAYLYAPKEDPQYFRNWREDWDSNWWRDFGIFTRHAQANGIRVMAGIAPGIDFNFASLASKTDDTAILINKAHALIDAGAHEITLLFDDINPLPAERQGAFNHEGQAHAALANLLVDEVPLSVTPRIYADEIIDGAQGYIEAFITELAPQINVFTCGEYIVEREFDFSRTALGRHGFAANRIIFWDNLYAHDYCPRRLFLGAWRGRGDAASAMFNLTGMLHTDCLLLDLIQAGEDDTPRKAVLSYHGVPEAFYTIAAFFDLPPNIRASSIEWSADDTPTGIDKGGIDKGGIDKENAHKWLQALDVLLWEWKAPLQREWYPWLMALRGDILMASGQADNTRIAKITPPILAHAFKRKQD